MKELVVADVQSCRNDKGQSVGHWFSLAKQFQELLSKDFRVRIAGGPVYKSIVAEKDLLLLPYDIDENIGGFERIKRFICNTRSLFKQSSNKIVIMQYGSPFATHLAVLLGYRKSHLFLIEYSTIGISGLFKKIVFCLLKPQINGIICPSEEIGFNMGKPYCVVPDYIYTGENELSDVDFKDKVYDFCIVGRISPEKGIIEAAKYFVGTKYKVVIAGLPETEELGQELKRICHHSKNIDLRLDFLSDYSFVEILRSSKYSLLNYRGVYASRSSGVVYDTIFNGVPVVGSRCMALDFVETNCMGKLYDNIESLNINELMDEEKYTLYKENIYEYCKSQKYFKEKLIDFLEKFSE